MSMRIASYPTLKYSSEHQSSLLAPKSVSPWWASGEPLGHVISSLLQVTVAQEVPLFTTPFANCFCRHINKHGAVGLLQALADTWAPWSMSWSSRQHVLSPYSGAAPDYDCGTECCGKHLFTCTEHCHDSVTEREQPGRRWGVACMGIWEGRIY